METDAQNMGAGTSSVFSGQVLTDTNRIHYAESAPFFAEEIRKLLESGEYTLADIGTYKGELLTEILKLLPEYKFKTIGVDINKEALEENKVVGEKVVCDARKLPFADKSIDIVIVRYMLQWNNSEAQKDILKEIARVIKRFAIIEHNGPDNGDEELWRKNSDRLLSGDEVSKMKRLNYFFASEAEVERWMSESGIEYKVLRSRKTPGLSNIYIERYLLDDKEAETARNILEGTDYVAQVDWLILPK